MTKPLVSIILLNWNGYEDTLEALESLYNIDYPNYNVIVADNNSTNDSVEKIKDYADGKIKIETQYTKYQDNNTIHQIPGQQTNKTKHSKRGRIHGKH